MSRRLIATGVAGVVAATCLSLTPAASGDEPAPLPSSPISIQSAERVVTESWRGRVWTDFGLRLVAGAEPFEIWSTRATYDDPITAVWRTTGGDVALPADAMRSFEGLRRFAKVAITRRDTGERVRRMFFQGCFNGYVAQRVHPDAPAESPYPAGCPWNPYTLGSVMGVQGGWSTPLFTEWGRSTRLAPGRYDVTATIRPEWVEFFDIAAEDATTTTRLRVKRGDVDEEFGRARPPAHRVARPAAREPRRASAGAPVPGTAPNLKSLPAFHIALNEKQTHLRFAATVWNGGGGPLVVDGFRPAGGGGHHHDHMIAYQYFFDADGNQTGHQEVGEFGWHGANHQHWHFEDFAAYRLLDSDRNLAVRSRKASFCLANTDAVDYTIPAADWRPENTDLSSDCGGEEALSLRQVLSNGSGDTYHQYRAGQAFNVQHLPDGVYYIEVVANPEATLVESDLSDNSSLRKVRIVTRPSGRRFVRVPQLGVIDEGGGF